MTVVNRILSLDNHNCMQVFCLNLNRGPIPITHTVCEIVMQAFLPGLASPCGRPPCTGAGICGGSEERVV